MSPVEMEPWVAEAPSDWGGEVPDEAVLERVRAGETELYEVLVHRHNPRLRRVARRVLSNEADVDEVIWEAHYKAFCSIHQFAGRSSFITWLTRIAIHSALSRLRHRVHLRELSPSSCDSDPLDGVVSFQRDPEQQLHDKEAHEALEAAARTLPEPYRTVFFLRRVQELSTSEAALFLEISEQCIKTRLHRARRLLDGRFPPQWKPLRSNSASAHASSATYCAG